MAVNLSIKGVPEDIAGRLRERALRNHRSLQGELMVIVAHAAMQADLPAGLTSVASAPGHPGGSGYQGGTRRGSKTIEEIAAEHLLLYPGNPFHNLPRAVDIIREDRDSR